jgi:hypothetical protein
MSTPASNPGGPASVELGIWCDGRQSVMRGANRKLIEEFGAHVYHLLSETVGRRRWRPINYEHY